MTPQMAGRVYLSYTVCRFPKMMIVTSYLNATDKVEMFFLVNCSALMARIFATGDRVCYTKKKFP